jgi:hypothetical protein
MSLVYEVMPVEKMFDDITDMNNQFIEQDSITLATVYKGNSGMYYLMPAVGHYGIKANKETIDSIIKSGIIPIEPERLNLFEKEKNRLEKINDNVDYYLSDLNEKLQMSLTTDKEIDTSLYKAINKKVKSLEPEEAYRQFFVPLGVVVGEIVRKKVNGEWKLNKLYGYNPYYAPYVTIGSNNNYLPWYKLADMLLNKKFDIKRYIEEVSKQKQYL